MSGPYETETEVAEVVSPVYASAHKRGVMRAKALARLVGICSVHDVQLGSYDRRVLSWLAAHPPEVAEVIADLIDRAGSGQGIRKGAGRGVMDGAGQGVMEGVVRAQLPTAINGASTPAY